MHFPRLIAGLSLVGLVFSSVLHAADFHVSDEAGLRQALIQAAQNGEDSRIVLAAAVYTAESIEPFSYNSTFKNDLMIEAAASAEEGSVILDGNNNGLVLSLRNADDGGTFTLRGLTIQSGLRAPDAAQRAGGLYIGNADAVVEDSVIQDNQNNSAENAAGSAIFYSGGSIRGTLTLNNVLVTGNTSSSSHTSRRIATLHMSRGRLLVTDSEFRDNQTNGDGTILTDLGGKVVNTLFERNKARLGSAIRGNVEVIDSVFRQNEASGSGTISGQWLTISNSEFIGNQADGSAAVSAGSGATIDRTLFEGNIAVSDRVVNFSRIGGDDEDYKITNSVFVGNQASEESGPTTSIIFCRWGCEISNSFFDGNSNGYAVFLDGTAPDRTTVANSIFLASNDGAIGFEGTGVLRASTPNNYIPEGEFGRLSAMQVINQADTIYGGDPLIDNDYSLREGSPLIDAGTMDAKLVTLSEQDLLGNRRIAGDSVDIGPIEFGSTNTLPLLRGISLETSSPRNMYPVTFAVDYELSEGRDFSQSELRRSPDGNYETITLDDDGRFETVFLEGGNRTITVRLTDSAGESAPLDYSFSLNRLTTQEVIDRTDEVTRQLCEESPDECGINLQAYIQAAKDACATDPASCNIDLESYVDEGKQQCIDDPASCGINVGSFDVSLVPAMGTGNWELFGTGQPITDLTTLFAEVKVVWIIENGNWKGFSTDSSVNQALNDNGIDTFSEIPANTGFWVKK